MKGKAVIPLILGLGIGLVAVKYGVDTIKRAQGSRTAPELVLVVQALEDIGDAVEITAEMVSSVETAPSAFVPALERIAKVEDVVGRVTAKSVPQGMPILTSMLAPKGTSAGMRGRIPPGFRAASVRIDEASSVGYQLKAGDWVDVTVVMDVGGTGTRRKETISEVILQRVQVGAVGRGSRGTDASKVAPKAAKSVTLLVREEDVPKLHLAGTKGKITLSLRGDDDLVRPVGPRATMAELMPGFGEPDPVPVEIAPVPPPIVAQVVPVMVKEAKPHTVMVVRGSTLRIPLAQIERITFEDVGSRRMISVAGPPGAGAAAVMGARSEGANGPRGIGTQPWNNMTRNEILDAAQNATDQ